MNVRHRRFLPRAAGQHAPHRGSIGSDAVCIGGALGAVDVA
jgi:hypothetical protein